MKTTEMAQPEAMESIRIFGQTIRYFDVGSGPALVLLHGLASAASLDWGKVINPLAATHRVLAMDQIGFGSSDKPEIDFCVQTYVNFLGEFLQKQNIKHFALAGVSFGGWVAAQYTLQALQARELPPPSRLLLSDSPGLRHDFDSSLLDGLLPSSIADQRQFLSKMVYDQSLVSDDAVKQLFDYRHSVNDVWTVRSLLSSLQTSNEGLDGKLQNITIPTLVIWGAQDEFIPLQLGKELAAGIPDSKLVVIDNCGHAPMFEKPDEFLTATIDFLM